MFDRHKNYLGRVVEPRSTCAVPFHPSKFAS